MVDLYTIPFTCLLYIYILSRNFRTKLERILEFSGPSSDWIYILYIIYYILYIIYYILYIIYYILYIIYYIYI